MRRLLPCLTLLLLLLPATARADDPPQLGALALSRFYDGGDRHQETVFAGAYAYERTLGYLFPGAGPDRHAIYTCTVAANQDRFLTGDANCEGQGPGQLQGYVLDAPPAGGPAVVPLNRCLQGNGYHFSSESPDCEGNRLEGTLGYMRPDSPELVRFYDPGTQRHWSGDDGAPAGFSYELGLGRLLDFPGPGHVPVYFCGGQDGYVTADGACGGAVLIGYALSSPGVDAPTRPLMRCVQVGITRFNSTDPGCEGQIVEEQIGWLPSAGAALQRYDDAATQTTWTTTGQPTAGFRYADTLGFLQPTGGPALQAVYGCASGADHRLSLTADCAGASAEGRLGFAYRRATAGARELFTCVAGPRHFVSTDSRCGGATPQGSIGWVPQTETAPPPPACGASAATVPSTLAGRVTRTVGFGKRAAVTGTARTAAGQPAAGVPVLVLAATGATVATGVTGPDGGFALQLPAGANRTVRAGFRASAADEALACGPALKVRVRAGVTLKAPRSVRRGRPLRLAGQVHGAGVRRGKTVVLQAFDGGRWRTFKTVRTRAAGRFAAAYRFSRGARRKRYPFRAVATTEARFPYAKGTSAVRRVRLR